MNINAFKREMKWRPYKRTLQDSLAILTKSLLALAIGLLVWLFLVGLGSI